eukprot:1070177-Alexandrium_andersonii.AAC.1
MRILLSTRGLNTPASSAPASPAPGLAPQATAATANSRTHPAAYKRFMRACMSNKSHREDVQKEMKAWPI